MDLQPGKEHIVIVDAMSPPAMDSPPIHKEPKQLLDFPIELRDKIYELSIFNLPLPDPSKGLRHMLRYREPISYKCLNTVTLHTDILQVSHQVSEEASSNILRKAQLVSVAVHGEELRDYVMQALAGSQIAVIPDKYRSFCVLRHGMTDMGSEPRYQDEPWEFILCGRDIECFCLALMGDVHYTVSEPINPDTSHTFTLLSPKKDLGPHASVLAIETNFQERLLRPYQTHLRGFRNVLVGAILPNKVDKVLKTALVNAMRSTVILDPVKFRNEIVHLTRLARNLSREGEQILALSLLGKSIERFFSLVSDETWPDLKLRGGLGYAESIAGIWYGFYVIHTVTTSCLIHQLAHEEGAKRISRPLLLATKKIYRLALNTGSFLGIHEWEPDPKDEARLNYDVARSIRIGCMDMNTPLGYVAIKRAVEISPDDEDIQRENQEYQENVGSFSEWGWDIITIDDLEDYLASNEVAY